MKALPILRCAGLLAAAILLAPGGALAGRGGGGHGGGFHGGGGRGGGFHPGGGFRPAAPAHFGGVNAAAVHPGGFRPAPGIGAPHTINNVGAHPNAFVGHAANFRNENININRANNFNGGHGWRGPYAGYHSGWEHGYWNGHYWPGGRGYGYGGYGLGGYGYGGYGLGGYGFGPLGWGLGGFGLGLATGIGAWGLGSSLYNWGYSNYYNPYYVAAPVGVQQSVVAAASYDYAQPIDTQAAPADQAAADAAMQTFDAAREAFKAGDYNKALELANQALKALPNDASLHEFRALVLFALGQYDQAAATLYAVLSNGPGWDWTTLIGLYPNVDVYTTQFRALEQYVQQHPGSVAARFVLAYHYMTQGHIDSAVAQLRRLVELQPSDKLSAQLLRQLTQTDPTAAGAGAASSTQPNGPAPQPQPQPTAANSNPAAQGNLAGHWTASPSKDTSIDLTLGQDGAFTWKVNGKGQDHQFAGTSTYGNGLLTLAPSQGAPFVGHVTWKDPDHFTFQISGGPDDPGVTFARSG